MTLLLLVIGIAGPGIAFKALAPRHFSLASYLLGQAIFFTLYTTNLFYIFTRLPTIPAFVQLILLITAAGLIFRPVFVSCYESWNSMVLARNYKWLELYTPSLSYIACMAAPLGFAISALIAGAFEANIAAFMPAYINYLYAITTDIQWRLLCYLSGSVGMLLLITYRIASLADGGDWQDNPSASLR